MIYVIFLVSLVAVSKGADWLVDGAVGIARALRISQIVVGATIVSLGTTLPEALVSSFAAYQGRSEVIAGTALGSILFNTAVILGIAVLIKPPLLTSKEPFFKAGTMIAVPVLFALLSLDHHISRWDALLLVFILILFLVSNMMKGMRESKEEAYTVVTKDLKKHVIQLVIGSAAVILGARFLLNSGVEIARALGVSEAIIALTLLAVGSSLPELITGITAARKGHTDLVLGNVMGANTLNIIFVIALAGLIQPFAVNPEVLRIEIPISLLMMGVLFVPALFAKRIGRWQGLITVLGYVVCLMFIISVR
ncbi:MAG TPA: calcium/sodium antiporter [Firmicutes bacterium]|nr:calcium/sodium antiporter [Bacillota bacterium]